MEGKRKREYGRWEAQHDEMGGDCQIARLPDCPISQSADCPIVLLPNRLIDNLDDLDCWQNYCLSRKKVGGPGEKVLPNLKVWKGLLSIYINLAFIILFLPLYQTHIFLYQCYLKDWHWLLSEYIFTFITYPFTESWQGIERIHATESAQS